MVSMSLKNVEYYVTSDFIYRNHHLKEGFLRKRRNSFLFHNALETAETNFMFPV